MANDRVILQIDDLRKYFAQSVGLFASLSGREPEQVKAVDGISLDIREGETVGLAGESGCGKTTLAKSLMRLHAPTSGKIWFEGQDIGSLRGPDLKAFRRNAQMVFQDPYESVNPYFTVEHTVMEPLQRHGIGSQSERREMVEEMLAVVGLHPVKSLKKRYPHHLSGGQRQRVAIARALVIDPKFLVADEPVSMLDVSIRASILHILGDMIVELGMACIYISHDLSLIRYMCDTTAIMYLGKMVEVGPTEEVMRDPAHPYTQALTAAVPVPDPSHRFALQIEGSARAPIGLGPGCRFADRCPEEEARCSEMAPEMKECGPGWRVACHRRE